MTISHLLAAAVVAGGTLVGGSAIGASAGEVRAASACRLVATTVGEKGDRVRATVGRRGCTNTASWSGEIKKNLKFRPDPVLARTTGRGNGTKLIGAACADRGKYYSYTKSSTGSDKRSADKTEC